MTKSIYRCNECGYAQPKWAKHCPGCGLWDTLQEILEEKASPNPRFSGHAGSAGRSAAVSLAEVRAVGTVCFPSGASELDWVLTAEMYSFVAGGDARAPLTSA